jgi:all-trans-8'-apo-beta-carotenal 15,15'-oxygenase
MYNAERRCSDLVILEGKDITAGPVSRLKLPHHVPYGLHGSFVPRYFGPDGGPDDGPSDSVQGVF